MIIARQVTGVKPGTLTHVTMKGLLRTLDDLARKPVLSQFLAILGEHPNIAHNVEDVLMHVYGARGGPLLEIRCNVRRLREYGAPIVWCGPHRYRYGHGYNEGRR